LRLIEEYGRTVTDLSSRLDSLRQASPQRNENDWTSAEASRVESQKAWEALEQHIVEHKCIPWSAAPGSGSIMEQAAMAAIEAIFVVDDDRRFVEANEAGAAALGRPRREVIGLRIDDFFSPAEGETMPSAWERFLAAGVRAGICELAVPGQHRRFDFRAKANFTPGFHLSVMRAVEDDKE
jgi:PAS domain-containing protein